MGHAQPFSWQSASLQSNWQAVAEAEGVTCAWQSLLKQELACRPAVLGTDHAAAAKQRSWMTGLCCSNTVKPAQPQDIGMQAYARAVQHVRDVQHWLTAYTLQRLPELLVLPEPVPDELAEILFAEPLATALSSGLAEALKVAAEAPGSAGNGSLLQKPSLGLKGHSGGSSEQRGKDRQQRTGCASLFPCRGVQPQQSDPLTQEAGASREEAPLSAAELVSCLLGLATAHVPALRVGLPVPGSAGQQQALEAVTASLGSSFAAKRSLVAEALQAEAAAMVTREMAGIGLLGAGQLGPAQQTGADSSQAGWADGGAAPSAPLLIKAAWSPQSDAEDSAALQSPSAAAISQPALQSRGPALPPSTDSGGTRAPAVQGLQWRLDPHSVTAGCWPTHAGSHGASDGSGAEDRPQLLDSCTARVLQLLSKQRRLSQQWPTSLHSTPLRAAVAALQQLLGCWQTQLAAELASKQLCLLLSSAACLQRWLEVLSQQVAQAQQGEPASAENMQGLEQQLAVSTSECRRWTASLEQALLQGHLGMVRSAVVGSLQRQQWQSQRQPATWPADAGHAVRLWSHMLEGQLAHLGTICTQQQAAALLLTMVQQGAALLVQQLAEVSPGQLWRPRLSADALLVTWVVWRHCQTLCPRLSDGDRIAAEASQSCQRLAGHVAQQLCPAIAQQQSHQGATAAQGAPEADNATGAQNIMLCHTSAHGWVQGLGNGFLKHCGEPLMQSARQQLLLGTLALVLGLLDSKSPPQASTPGINVCHSSQPQ